MLNTQEIVNFKWCEEAGFRRFWDLFGVEEEAGVSVLEMLKVVFFWVFMISILLFEADLLVFS